METVEESLGRGPGYVQLGTRASGQCGRDHVGPAALGNRIRAGIGGWADTCPGLSFDLITSCLRRKELGAVGR